MSDDGWFKAWFAFCAVASIASAAFTVWVVVTLVEWVTTK